MLPKDVHVRLHYLIEQRNGEKETGKSSKRKLSCAANALSVLETIHDVRGAHEEFNLDLQGFCFVKAPTKFEGWASKQEIRRVYVPEIEDLLRQELDGCDEIHVISIEVGETFGPCKWHILIGTINRGPDIVSVNRSTSITPHRAWSHCCTRRTRRRPTIFSLEEFD